MILEVLNQHVNPTLKALLTVGDVCFVRSGMVIASSERMHFKVSSLQLSGLPMYSCYYLEDVESSGNLWLGAGLPGDMIVFDTHIKPIIVRKTAILMIGVDSQNSSKLENELSNAVDEEWLQFVSDVNLAVTTFGASYHIDVEDEYKEHLETARLSLTRAAQT